MVCPYSNLLRKTNFPSISLILSEIVTFLTKREVFSELGRKCFKKTEKHRLSVCGTFLEKNSFLLIFVPFCCFDQKGLFTANPNFPLDLLLFKLFEKTNLLTISVLLSEIVIFLTKKRIFQWIIFPKMLQNREKHSLAVCG